MNADQIKLVAAVVSALQPSQQSTEQRDFGQNIVVLDRGFVYVGDVKEEGEYLRITKAKNIRFWGTKNGLGELRNGPLPETELDEAGEILAPKRALIHLVPCTGF